MYSSHNLKVVSSNLAPATKLRANLRRSAEIKKSSGAALVPHFEDCVTLEICAHSSKGLGGRAKYTGDICADPTDTNEMHHPHIQRHVIAK